MKKRVLFLGLAVCLSVAAIFAQGPQREGGRRGLGIPVEEMIKQLKLDKEQVAKLEKLNTDFQQKMEKLRAATQTMPQDERRAAMTKISEERNSEIKKVLTKEQADSYDKMMNERRERMMNRDGQQRQGGNRGGDSQ